MKHRIRVPNTIDRLTMLTRAIKCLFTGVFEVGMETSKPRKVKTDEHCQSSWSTEDEERHVRKTEGGLDEFLRKWSTKK